jgi:hypothetical protein
MSGPIRTKWHRIRTIVEKGDPDSIFTFATTLQYAQPFFDVGGDLEALQDITRNFDSLPKFVIDKELFQIIQEEDYVASIRDMQKAGVLRLPFSACLVEIEADHSHFCMMLRDLTDFTEPYPFEGEASEIKGFVEHHPDIPFYGIPFALNYDDRGEFLCVPINQSWINLMDVAGVPNINTYAYHNVFYKRNPEVERLSKELVIKEAGYAWQALAALTVIIGSGGVEKEVVETTKLNKRRVASGKTPIPRYTYIHVGRVYKSSEGTDSEAYVPGRSKRPHWRRGHIWPNGKTPETRWRPGRLVAYKGGPLPAMPTTVVMK